MSATTLYGRDVTVEIARGASPTADPAGFAWTDCTAYVQVAAGISIHRGRTAEFAAGEPMTCQLVLNNTDGRWTPGNRSGAWWPDARKSLPIRVRVGSSVRFTGYLDDLAPTWPGPTTSLSWMQVTASSRFRREAQMPKSAMSVLQRSVMASLPSVYWPLEDGEGTATAYSLGQSAAPLTARTGGVAWQALDGAAGFGKTVSVDSGDSELGGDIAPGIIPNTGDVQILCYVPTDAPDGDYWTVRLDTTSGSHFDLVGITCGGVGGVNTIYIVFYLAGSVVWSASKTVSKGWHHIRLWTENTIVVPSIPPVYVWQVTAEVDGVYVADTTFNDLVWPSRSVRLFGGRDTVGGSIEAGFGHLVIAESAVSSFYRSATGWDQETASARFVRLAGELGIPVAATPNAPMIMGTQREAASLALLQETADAELGMLYETADGRAAMQGRAERYNPAVFLALDIAAGDVAQGFAPVFDDQQLVNEAIASRPDGSAALFSDDTSKALYGVYHKDVTVNLGRDSDLLQVAAWLASRSSDPSLPRLAVLPLNLRTLPALKQDAWLAGEPLGSLVTVASPPSQMDQSALELFVEGYTEYINVDRWDASLSTSAAGGLTSIATLGGAVPFRLDCDGQTLAAGYSAGATSLSVATAAGRPLLSVDAGDYPVDVRIDGRKVTATACAGAASPQTLTVAALSNALPSGAALELYDPVFLAL